jgi:hypothetical protein
LCLRPLHVAYDETRVVQVELCSDARGHAFSVRSRPVSSGASADLGRV